MRREGTEHFFWLFADCGPGRQPRSGLVPVPSKDEDWYIGDGTTDRRKRLTFARSEDVRAEADEVEERERPPQQYVRGLAEPEDGTCTILLKFDQHVANICQISTQFAKETTTL